MSLPKLNTPTYKIKLQSLNKEVIYRPFLVREEKILLTAMESDDTKEIVDGVKQIINNCIIDQDIDVNKLPSFDIELLFLNIRSRSIGESIDVIVKHPNEKNSSDNICSHQQQITINLDDVKVVMNDSISNNIKLTEDVGVIMKYPTLEQSMKFDANTADGIFDLLTDCIDSIYDNEQVYDTSTTSRTEMNEFLLSLNQKQFGLLMDFYQNMPKVRYETTYVCEECKNTEKVVMEGMQNFFG